MQRIFKSIAFLLVLLAIIQACTKRIDLRTEVEFEVVVEHAAMGNVNENLSTTITVIPEAVLEDFSYSYSYSILKGEGHLNNRSGEILPQNENMALNPFSATLTYAGTSAGAHSLKVIATDNYGFSETVNIDYIVEENIVVDTSKPDDNDEINEVAKSDMNEILAFAITGQTGQSSIDTIAYTISVDVPFGTELNVAPSMFTLSPLAEIDASELGQRNFSSPATYSVKAENGDIQEWTVTVMVGPKPNDPPTVDAGDDFTVTLKNSPTGNIILDGNANDIDGTYTTEWTIVSGGAATIAGPSSLLTAVTELTRGTYVFRLTATDDDGAMNTDTITVKVNASPTADAGKSINLTLPTNAVNLAGLAGDVDGTFTIEWTQVEIKGVPATIVNPNALDTEVTGLPEGQNVFELTVTDNDGATAVDRMFVEVKPAP